MSQRSIKSFFLPVLQNSSESTSAADKNRNKRLRNSSSEEESSSKSKSEKSSPNLGLRKTAKRRKPDGSNFVLKPEIVEILQRQCNRPNVTSTVTELQLTSVQNSNNVEQQNNSLCANDEKSPDITLNVLKNNQNLSKNEEKENGKKSPKKIELVTKLTNKTDVNLSTNLFSSGTQKLNEMSLNTEKGVESLDASIMPTGMNSKTINNSKSYVVSNSSDIHNSDTTLQASATTTRTIRSPKSYVVLNISDVDSYDPSSDNCQPLKAAFWGPDSLTPFAALAKTLNSIENTSGRLKIIETLSNYICSVIATGGSDDLLASVYFCTNSLGPSFLGSELGVSETTILKVIAKTSGRNLQVLKTENQRHFGGDFGALAESSRHKQCKMSTFFGFKDVQKANFLTVRHVFEIMKDISAAKGKDSQNKKSQKIEKLLVDSIKGYETKFMIRFLSGGLRIGLAEQSVLQSLASATLKSVVTEKKQKVTLEEAVDLIKKCYSRCPSYDLLIPNLLEYGIESLSKYCKLCPGIPVKPMLAQPAKGINEVFSYFSGNSSKEDVRMTFEYKYDGERIQIHVDDVKGVRKLFSRNQEDSTGKFPDVLELLDEFRDPVKVRSFILDCEVVAWDEDKNIVLPFQVLSTRKRKVVELSEIKIKICIFAFDLLYINDSSLLEASLVERRQTLLEYFRPVPGKFAHVERVDTTDRADVERFLRASITSGRCEGLIAKSLESNYEPSRRSRKWLKLKKDYIEEGGGVDATTNFAETLDLVVMGAFYGKGRRRQGYGGFLLGCRDDEHEEYQALCKIGSGFSDADLKAFGEHFVGDRVVERPKHYYRCGGDAVEAEIDAWFDPDQVWEVKFADLTLSTVYPAAIGIIDPEKGISLRFPRFVRVRNDKKIEEATTADQIAEMYRKQNRNDDVREKIEGEKKDRDEDFY